MQALQPDRLEPSRRGSTLLQSHFDALNRSTARIGDANAPKALARALLVGELPRPIDDQPRTHVRLLLAVALARAPPRARAQAGPRGWATVNPSANEAPSPRS